MVRFIQIYNKGESGSDWESKKNRRSRPLVYILFNFFIKQQKREKTLTF